MSTSGRVMTVDALARRARLTTRTVRAHQTLGLVPPPRIEGRTALYGDTHLERLRAIDRLQGEGFSLAAIHALFDAFDEGRTLDEVVGLTRPARGPRRSVDERRSTRLRLALVPGPVANELQSA